MLRILSRLLLGAIPSLAALPSLAAQCANPWLSTGGHQGVDGTVNAARMHDPDGAGPVPARLVVGGSFSAVSNVLADNVAAWDPTTGTWSPLGTGLPTPVVALAALPNGELVAATTWSSTAPDFCIARWNGTSWLPMGAGFADTSVFATVAILTLAVDGNGHLVAGGRFTSAGGTPASNIARWNGAAWSAMGAGTDDLVTAAATLPTGGIVVGGYFSAAGGAAANRIARWDGAAWTPVGPGITPTGVYGVTALAVLGNGDVLGGWTTQGFFGPPSSFVARWNGTAWSQVGPLTMPGAMHAIAALPNGDLLAAGGHGHMGANLGFCNRWNGAAWSSFAPSPLGEVFDLTALPNTDVVMAGRFTTIGALAAVGLGRWDGVAWRSMGIFGLWSSRGWPAMAVAPNGDVLVGGEGVQRWNGSVWSPLGGTFPSAGPIAVWSLLGLPSGEAIVGGLPNLGGNLSGPGIHVARWNGAAWVAMGNGLNSYVNALATLPDGSVVAGGSFTASGAAPLNGLARWNGTAWSDLGGGVVSPGAPMPGTVYALAVAPNGDLVVGGQFGRAGTVPVNNIARWNGATWSALGGGSGGVNGLVLALAFLPNGDLVAAGYFATASGVVVNNVARWNGATWAPLGNGLNNPSNALATLPDGSVVARAGSTQLARWNGANWSAMGSGFNGAVESFAFRPSGEFLIGGMFTRANGLLSPGVVRVATTCPASATATGAGCVGVGGPNVLTASSLPWLGANCVTTASGLPPASLAVVVTGLSAQSQRLAAVLPQGAPGCSLLVATDLMTAVTTGAGTASSALPLPNNVAFVGVSLRQQVVALEIVAGSIVAATSTNALVLQTGTF